jgi:hypothetical protein
MMSPLYHMLFWWLIGIYHGAGDAAETSSARWPVASSSAPCPPA